MTKHGLELFVRVGLLAADGLTLLLGFEAMSLASWALVASDHAKAENRRAARLYLAFAALGAACLIPALGLLAGLLRSNLEVPPQMAKFLSLYLLMALGLKGGFALSESGLTASIMTSLFAAVLMAFIVPVIGYSLLRRFVPPFDAAAVAASYGSVSAVTFVTAMQYVEAQQIPVGGQMAVAMVLMESPAIIVAVVLANVLRRQHDSSKILGKSA